MPERGTCHLWLIRVDGREANWNLLSAAERAQAARFRVAHARTTYVTSRAAQRRVAALYGAGAAARVKITRQCTHCQQPHGRPRIEGAGFDYSVSHTTSWVAVAIVAAGLVGVDLEPAAQRSITELAPAILTSRELSQMNQVPAADRERWLLSQWTRKEAAVKLTGHGLAAEFNQVDVCGSTVAAAEVPAGWLRGTIHLTDLPDPPAHAGALATTRALREVLLWK